MCPALAGGFLSTVPPGKSPTRDFNESVSKKAQGMGASLLVNARASRSYGHQAACGVPRAGSLSQTEIRGKRQTLWWHIHKGSPAELCHLAPWKSQGHPWPQTRGCQQEIISEKSFLRPLRKVCCLPTGGPSAPLSPCLRVASPTRHFWPRQHHSCARDPGLLPHPHLLQHGVDSQLPNTIHSSLHCPQSLPSSNFSFF